MQPGQKHLIKCRCILSQFKKKSDPPLHQFVVFSQIDDDGNVVMKYSQCNNCGVVHKVVDICKSEILGTKENMSAILTIEDIKPCMPANLVGILEKNAADLPTWEACQHIVDNKLWGQHVVLTTDKDEDKSVGKYVRILGESLFKVESYSRQEVVSV